MAPFIDRWYKECHHMSVIVSEAKGNSERFDQ